MLSDFFRINLPYGMKRNSRNEWMFFNREFLPIGWSTRKRTVSLANDDAFTEIPIYVKYKGLTETRLLNLSWDPELVQRDDFGKINQVFFYNDETNPQNDPQYWNLYLEKLMSLSKCEVDRKVLS
jgi:hypothetical protein